MLERSFGELRTTVTAKTTATMGSWRPAGFATPAMVAMMEHAALGVAAELPEGSTDGGSRVEPPHLKPSVWARRLRPRR